MAKVKSSPAFLSTGEAAALLGFCRATINRICGLHPGFAVRVDAGGKYMVPREHVDRVLAGETPAEIAAEVHVRRAAA